MNFNAAEALQEQVGRAIVVFLACADDSHSGYAVGRFKFPRHVKLPEVHPRDGKKTI